MRRAELTELFERIERNALLALAFLKEYPDDNMVAAELLGRCAIVDAKLAEIRQTLAEPASVKAEEKPPEGSLAFLRRRTSSDDPSAA